MQQERRAGLTGRIRIVRIPAGEAPLEIRMAWVGLVLPCYPVLGYPQGEAERGVLTNSEVGQNRKGFSIPQAEAISVLERGCPEAVIWWEEHGYPKKGECFHFAEHEVTNMGETIHQRIILFDDVGGHPMR